MQIHKTIKPNFVSKFQCVGPECLISCCRGWSIHIDKKTHQKYISSHHSDISRIAKENLILQRKGKMQYSMIKLDEKGDCPFIDENKLCMVHRDLGESALSHTCTTYPRNTLRYQEETLTQNDPLMSGGGLTCAFRSRQHAAPGTTYPEGRL